MGWSCAPSSLLRSDLAADLEGLRRFEEEARAAARISHPAVVTVFDSGEHDGTAYLVMECLPGRSLADEIAQGPLLAARVRHLAEELLGALASAHEVGVIHRDIKPSNVLLADDGSPKLADFGIAKTLDAGDHTRTGMVIGTVAYLAPERLAGERATPASDLYSLGVVLYEALTGDKRFPGDTPVAVAHAISTQHPVPVERRVPGVAVDPVLAEVVDRVLSRDPSQRYASAADMRAALTSADANATRPVKATAAYEIPHRPRRALRPPVA